MKKRVRKSEPKKTNQRDIGRSAASKKRLFPVRCCSVLLCVAGINVFIPTRAALANRTPFQVHVYMSESQVISTPFHESATCQLQLSNMTLH